MIPTKPDEVAIYNAAWRTWGPYAQFDVCIEEMAELTKEIIKDRRRERLFSNDMIEELVDVRICIDQIEYMIGQSSEASKKKIEEIRREKLTRLAERIADAPRIE